MALESYDQERLAWEYLGAFVKERGIKPSDPYTEYCEFPDEGGAAEAFAGGRPEPYQEEEPMVPDGGGAADRSFVLRGARPAEKRAAGSRPGFRNGADQQPAGYR
ncbi:MAG: hypothetical protein RR934_07845, partial [Gordonibacter sp.]